MSSSRPSSNLRSSKTIANPSSSGPPRRKASPARRSSARASVSSSSFDDTEAPGRVRVSVRVRPKNAEDLASDAEFSDCVELQPEFKKLTLKRNNWISESYKFDEVFTEVASQKRVYEVVAKPVVESVLDGYNGTVMAYGQTGTGKTYTVGRLGKRDPSERGIMVRALEDILSSTSPAFDTVSVSYLQLYMESIQDLLAPEKINIPIVEDPKTGEISLPGSSVVKIQDIDHAIQLLEYGETNRHAANTKHNTESSRSHAILLVVVQRAIKGNGESEKVKADVLSDYDVPVLLKSKLLIVDLAGSERIDKSGSEGHTLEEAKSINLSLTSLGKCINAIAENSPHIPTRDSKLTRLLRDSFGGSARTSLVITVSPSARHQGETASTISFGQRAMKIENMVKLREEFDYESLCRKLESQVDSLTAENERLKKLRDSEKKETESRVKEYQKSSAEAERRLSLISESSMTEKKQMEEEMKHVLADLNIEKDHNNLLHDEIESLQLNLNKIRLELQLERQKHSKEVSVLTESHKESISKMRSRLEDEKTGWDSLTDELQSLRNKISEEEDIIEKLELENSKLQKILADTKQLFEKKMSEMVKYAEDEHTKSENVQRELLLMKQLTNDQKKSIHIQEQIEMDELRKKIKDLNEINEGILKELQTMNVENEKLFNAKTKLGEELQNLQQKLYDKETEKRCIEDELSMLKKVMSTSDNEILKSRNKENFNKETMELGNLSTKFKSFQSRDTTSLQKATITKIFEEVGLPKILALLRSEDSDVQIHAVKVVANLAAEDVNQEKIVKEGGLDALLLLLESSQNETIYRVASGALANLAMNENNQAQIMSKGGASLLCDVAVRTDDSQTLRMVAGAIANLCGNEKLHIKLKEDGGIKALLQMAKSGHSDVIAQVARGIANFAKCESRKLNQGHKDGQSLLIDDGALGWIIANSTCSSSSTRRHVELALCHLAQNEQNATILISTGAIKELIRIARESTRDDIRSLAKRTISSNPGYRMQRSDSAFL